MVSIQQPHCEPHYWKRPRNQAAGTSRTSRISRISRTSRTQNERNWRRLTTLITWSDWLNMASSPSRLMRFSPKSSLSSGNRLPPWLPIELVGTCWIWLPRRSSQRRFSERVWTNNPHQSVSIASSFRSDCYGRSDHVHTRAAAGNWEMRLWAALRVCNSGGKLCASMSVSWLPSTLSQLRWRSCDSESCWSDSPQPPVTTQSVRVTINLHTHTHTFSCFVRLFLCLFVAYWVRVISSVIMVEMSLRPACKCVIRGNPVGRLEARGRFIRPMAASRRLGSPATGNGRPATGHRQRAPGNRQPATSHRPPATGNGQSATGNRQRGALIINIRYR